MLKTCKIQTASRNCTFSVYHSWKLHMRTPFIRRILKCLLNYPILWPKNFRCAKFYSHTTHNYPTMAKILIFFILMRGHAMLDLSLPILYFFASFLVLSVPYMISHRKHTCLHSCKRQGSRPNYMRTGH